MSQDAVGSIVGAVLADEACARLLPMEVTDAMLGRKPKRGHLQKYYELIKTIITFNDKPQVGFLMMVMAHLAPQLDQESMTLQCWAIKRLVSRVRDVARCKSVPRQWEVRELRQLMLENWKDNGQEESSDDGDSSADSSDANPAHVYPAVPQQDNQSDNVNQSSSQETCNSKQGQPNKAAPKQLTDQPA
jgi:hypothetical protein